MTSGCWRCTQPETIHPNEEVNTMTRLVTTAQDLVVSAIDLTRACTENELYLAWLTTYSEGSQFAADYIPSLRESADSTGIASLTCALL